MANKRHLMLGSKYRKPVDRLPADWIRPRPMREMRMVDLTVDSDGKPLIGTPLGRREIVLTGCFCKEEFKMGRLIGWHGQGKGMPIIEYPDGTREVVPSMSETNWKH